MSAAKPIRTKKAHEAQRTPRCRKGWKMADLIAADFWNGVLRGHANANTIGERVTKAVAPTDYRGWTISWDYGEYSATGPNYDASYEGPEDGWVDNGERVFARTLDDLRAEVDAYLEDRPAPAPTGKGDL